MKRRILAFVVILALPLGLCNTFADKVSDTGQVEVNGKCRVYAIEESGETYFPLRDIVEACNGCVEWDGQKRLVNAGIGGKSCHIYAYEEGAALIDGKMYISAYRVKNDLGFSLEFNDNGSIGRIYFENDPEDMPVLTVDGIKEAVLADEDSSFGRKLSAYMPDDVNCIFSPLSIKYAFAMAANGADDEGKAEILRVLGTDSIEDYNKSVRAELERFSSDDEYSYKFNAANSIWINEDEINGAGFNDTFKAVLTQYYFAEADIVNRENAVDKINAWCREKTNDLIPKIVNEPDFLACIANAVYFKGAWVNKFDEYYTAVDIFNQGNGAEAQTDFMNKTAYYNYYGDNNIRMLEVPYRGGASMYIAISDNENIDYEKYIDKLNYVKVDASIPKFKIEFTADCRDMLSKMGINAVFDEKNTTHLNNMFNSVCKNYACITDVIHKAYIDVDENGTEAAAATAIFAGTTSAAPQLETTYKFKADKPFVYFIRDNASEEILFMGRYAYVD